MKEVLREPSQRTSCYFNCRRSSSRSRFSNQNWWLDSYRSWSGNTKPQELKSSWYWLCHVCRSHQAWWRKATWQVSPLGKALSAFWKLDRVWKSRASLQQKVKLFILSALSVLLYGCESSVLTSDPCHQIDSFQMSCIKIVLGVSRTDHVGNEEVYGRTGTVSFSQSLQALQIRFLGHCLHQIHFVYTSNQDIVDINSISRESDYSRFKEQCLRVNALIKKTKVDYYSGIIRESSNNPRTLFNTVNKLLHKRVPAEYPSGCASDGDLANKFIDFFGEKITVRKERLCQIPWCFDWLWTFLEKPY